MIIERCTGCRVAAFTPRTNGDGLCYLECDRCGTVEPVLRRPDPTPYVKVRYQSTDGIWRTRYRVREKANRRRKAS